MVILVEKHEHLRRQKINLLFARIVQRLLVLVLEQLLLFEELRRQLQYVHDDGEGDDEGAEENHEHQLKQQLYAVISPLIQQDEGLIPNALQVQDWDQGYADEETHRNIHEYHYAVLDFQCEIIEFLRLTSSDEWYQGHHQDAYWEKCDCNA